MAIFKDEGIVNTSGEFSELLLKAPAAPNSTLPLSEGLLRPFSFETAVRETGERWV